VTLRESPPLAQMNDTPSGARVGTHSATVCFRGEQTAARGRSPAAGQSVERTSKVQATATLRLCTNPCTNQGALGGHRAFFRPSFHSVALEVHGFESLSPPDNRL
jgi:hypothetical protein